MFRLRVNGLYVCWDSFKAEWFLGKKRLAEIFSFANLQFDRIDAFCSFRGSAARVAESFPTAKRVWVRDPA